MRSQNLHALSYFCKPTSQLGEGRKPEEILRVGVEIGGLATTAIVVETALGLPVVGVLGVLGAGGLIGFGFCKALECFNSPQN